MFSLQSRTHVKRLGDNEIAEAREKRLKDIQMWLIIREFTLHIIFSTLIFVITYANCEQNSFHQVKHLRSYFFNTRQTTLDYTQVGLFVYLDRSFNM